MNKRIVPAEGLNSAAPLPREGDPEKMARETLVERLARQDEENRQLEDTIMNEYPTPPGWCPDLDSLSDLALFHLFKHELERIGRGEKLRLPSSARRRLGRLGLIARPGASLTPKGRRLLAELDELDPAEYADLPGAIDGATVWLGRMGG